MDFIKELTNEEKRKYIEIITTYFQSILQFADDIDLDRNRVVVFASSQVFDLSETVDFKNCDLELELEDY